MKKTIIKNVAIIIWLLVLFNFTYSSGRPPEILSVNEQARVVNLWLEQRLEKILPELMRREGLDMWIVICQEYNEDPVYSTLVPFENLSARRLSMLVFFDRGKEKGVEKFSISRYPIGEIYPALWDQEKEPDQWKALAEQIKTRNPSRIAIDESATFALADGLSATNNRLLAQYLGPAYSQKFCSAERLVVGWLERRLPEEIEVYHHLARIAHQIIQEGFSEAAITPGITTSDQLEWWFWQKITSLGLKTWFSPSVDILRPDSSPYKDNIIRRGDLLHCDVGLTYLRLNTDHQEQAYVLRPGETEAPAGLKEALRRANRVQDILIGEFIAGRTGNQILSAALKKTNQEGLEASIYTHPLGFHGHAAGPTIGLWDQQDEVPGRGDYELFYDTCYAIELNCRSKVPEWGNQEVVIGLEQDASFTKEGVIYLDGRQTKFHLIY
ncbi:MAG: M24 family metallopeptidase [Acidobacteriota bacterium]|nr:M24 family metallopeptidase [Acidobacteriota bacterium]MDW3228783.1 M24 family metallopeptidase [Acidobacteriota bacterium]